MFPKEEIKGAELRGLLRTSDLGDDGNSLTGGNTIRLPNDVIRAATTRM
jgi:hypothetical protein